MSQEISSDPLEGSQSLTDAHGEEVHEYLAAEQVQRELAQAADQSMVSTRSQDQRATSSSIEPSRPQSIEGVKKRKADRDLPLESQGRAPKRRLMSKNPGQHDEEETPKLDIDSDGHQRGVSIAEVDAVAQENHPGNHETSEECDSINMPSQIVERETLNNAPNGISLKEDENSDDEAPEALTISAGFDASRAASTKAAKILREQKASQRAKRKDRDAKLKAQSKTAKKAKTKNADPSFRRSESADGDGGSEAGFKGAGLDRGEEEGTKPLLPERLPDDLLASEPIIDLPFKAVSRQQQKSSKPQKLLLTDSKPPKDVKRGNRKIRVLQMESNILPPKASGKSKTIRESWLVGRRGVNGNMTVPRKTWSQVFGRRQ